ncbi:ribosome-associated heat shock protein Hsp15 [Salinispirillum sp. LH 10-3-1]|uniref:Heat shock protein 15 n=1 Tax=Salinispirillum sp. LH 10-3-1 TaxID=2952525 RepID=A0AB38YGC8_9GAMM
MNDVAVRLDKWLWAARFFKTRSLAKSAIENGKVHYDGTRAKPSRTVEVGATLRLRLGWEEKTVEVRALSEQRGPASVAQTLYEETADSIARRAANADLRRQAGAVTAAPDHRPNKKQRRDLLRLKDQNSEH